MGNTSSPSYLAGFLAATGAVAADAPATSPADPRELLAACARDNQPPGPVAARRLQELGCFYEAPHQDAFRLRLRLPGGRLQRSQLAALAGITQECGGGWLEWNARGGLDLPSVPVRAADEAFRRIEALALAAREPDGTEDARTKPAPSQASTGLPLPSGRLLSSHLARLAAWLDACGETEVRLVEPGSLLVSTAGPVGEIPEAVRSIFYPDSRSGT